jgi:hypothetical protein
MITATDCSDTTPNGGVNNTRIRGVRLRVHAFKIGNWTSLTTVVPFYLPAAFGLLILLLAGCGTSTPPSAQPVASAPLVSAPAPKASLLEEERRLAELFRGTPVVFAMQPDGSMRVEVPLRYCFDNGAAIIKAPLAAVLDRVARSQRDEATHLSVAAPNDSDAKKEKASLAAARSTSTRDYLVAHGIALKRLSIAPPNGKTLKIVVANTALP